MMKVIGTTTTYIGKEFYRLRGETVRILAVIRGALQHPGLETSAGAFVTDDETLARCGGVKEFDRILVAHLHADGTSGPLRWSARAIDLAAFSNLATRAR